MSADNKRVSLAADIARVLGGKRMFAETPNASAISSRCLLATGVALAVMQTQPAQAVSLGELRVQSGLGQPFVATTTARLGPGETIASNCVTAPAAAGNGLNSPKGIKVSAQSGATSGRYPIQIRTTQPLYEPMYEIRLQVDCPGGVALSKSYVVMLNLPMAAPVESVTAPSGDIATTNNAASTTNARQPGRSTAPSRADAGALSASRAGIPTGERYRVRNGDTLSGIAERVEGRPVGSTWRVADMLFAANPRAFIRGDRNMIKLGALLEIPTQAELNGSKPQESTADTPAALPGNEQPAVNGGDLVNVTLGRPEEVAGEAVSNETLLREIREANLEQAAAGDGGEITELATAAAPENNNEFAAMPAQEAASPFADEAADVADSAAEATPAVTTAPAAVVAENSQQSGMSPLVAAAAGIFMGMLLALAMLGRKVVAPLLEGRARRKAALEKVAVETAAQPQATEFAPVRPAYGGGGIDVEIGEAEQSTATEVDVDLSAAPEDDAAAVTQGNTPRVSLRGDADSSPDSSNFDGLLDGLDDDDNATDKTARFEAPPLNTPLDANAEIKPESSENTGTMRSLFDEAAEQADVTSDVPELHAGGETVEIPDTDEAGGETVEMAEESESVTAELPAVNTDEVADIDITDLESLSRQLQETQDDKLSATLTQALGLLEQDYEEEMTASQILEKQEVDRAFSQHKAKD